MHCNHASPSLTVICGLRPATGTLEYPTAVLCQQSRRHGWSDIIPMDADHMHPSVCAGGVGDQ